MGTDSPLQWETDGEGPIREVMLNPFCIDRTAVTNRSFAQFVEATGYQTDSQRIGWSFVFRNHLPRKYAQQLARTRAVVGSEWWLGVPDACWCKPLGSRSDLSGQEDHPVVHVSWNDAQQYCRWAGKRLPSEAEWEYAARGGLAQAIYPWGDELTPKGKHHCNVWQGKFPQHDTAADGFAGTCPADAFGANGYGLYNCVGNIWEWIGDWFSVDWHQTESSTTRQNPHGPNRGQRKTQKGGSYLCHHSYCNRYRVAARTANTPDSAADNAGFRCVRDIAPQSTPAT